MRGGGSASHALQPPLHMLGQPPGVLEMSRHGAPMFSPSAALYTGPLAQGPAVATASDDNSSCVVNLFDVSITYWGQIDTAAYAPPADCPWPWASVALELEGRTQGVQYDRYGALWLGGVEILRTTTPEPLGYDEPPISWNVDRKLTQYSPLFRSAADAKLVIPNTVDSTYTGPLNITARLRFVSATAESSSASWASTAADAVVSVLSPFADEWGGKFAFDVLSTTAEANVSGVVSFPSRLAVRALLDVYAKRRRTLYRVPCKAQAP